MLRIYLLFTLFITYKISHAQCEEELKLINQEKIDSVIFKKYQKLLVCYINNNNTHEINSTLNKLSELSKQLINKYSDSVFYRDVLVHKSNYYYQIPDLKKCLEVTTELLNYDYRHFDSIKISSTLGNISIIYRKIGNYPKSIFYILEAIKINESLKNIKHLSNNYNNLGNLYADIKKYDKANEFYKKAIQIRVSINDEAGIASSYNNLANNFSLINEIDSAKKYYYKALQYHIKLKSQANKIVVVYNNLTDLYVKQNNLDSSLKFSLLTERLINENSIPTSLIVYYLNKSYIKILQKKYNEALIFTNKAIQYAVKLNNKEQLITLYFYKAQCYYYLKNIDSTYYYLNTYSNYKDTLLGASSMNEITRHEMQYEFDIEQAELKNIQLKKDLEIKNELERKQILIYSIAFGLLLLIILVFFILKSNYHKKKDNLKLQQQNTLIENQKKDIIDSINYAKNLQQAILPSQNKLNEALGDNFIFYKPKDIIAGDFYWLYQSNSKINLFAVADCTGHGVPGAMVSVVCSKALDTAVKEYNLINPGQILDKAKQLVLDTFSKTAQNIQDGMDISLCSIQYNNDDVIVKWAGANNSLWFIQNNIVNEIKANKQPVGLSNNSSSFTTHNLKLNKGDLLYFITDGFSDQFGGEKGKKFMSKNLRIVLSNNAHLPMHQQKELLEKTFASWKGNMEQVDDVTIIGVRV